MNETTTMLELWRKWEAQIDDLGKDLAVTSAMNEYAELQVKNLNLHSVSVSDFDYPYITQPDDENCIHPLDALMFWNDGTVECKLCGMRSVKF
jgi:hypothetical protein